MLDKIISGGRVGAARAAPNIGLAPGRRNKAWRDRREGRAAKLEPQAR